MPEKEPGPSKRPLSKTFHNLAWCTDQAGRKAGAVQNKATWLLNVNLVAKRWNGMGLDRLIMRWLDDDHIRNLASRIIQVTRFKLYWQFPSQVLICQKDHADFPTNSINVWWGQVSGLGCTWELYRIMVAFRNYIWSYLVTVCFHIPQ